MMIKPENQQECECGLPFASRGDILFALLILSIGVRKPATFHLTSCITYLINLV